MQKSTREIQLISARQLNPNLSSNLRNDDSYYLPLRYNQAGVMPIILTSAVLVIPNYIINSEVLPALSFLKSFKFLYWIMYFGLILGFSSFYSFIVVNPKDLSDQLQKLSVTIPGLRPGIQTTFYLKKVITRITLIGGTMLAIITVIPNFLGSISNISDLNVLSTTLLLIMAGVILDLIREIENVYYSNIYK